MFWLDPKIKPAHIDGKIYSEDLLLLISGDVYTGYYSRLNWYIFDPYGETIICVPDGWLPRNVLPMALEQKRQLNLYGEKDGS